MKIPLSAQDSNRVPNFIMFIGSFDDILQSFRLYVPCRIGFVLIEAGLVLLVNRSCCQLRLERNRKSLPEFVAYRPGNI